MAHDLTRNPPDPSLNPPHDTRHDTRLPVLTEVDGSMAPLEELDDSTKGLAGWRKTGFVVKLFDPYYRHQGFIFIPLS
jgi:hypothetical protein